MREAEPVRGGIERERQSGATYVVNGSIEVSLNAGASTVVETIGDGFGAGGGVHDAPSGLRSTTYCFAAGSAVHASATADFVADVAFRAAGAADNGDATARTRIVTAERRS